MKDFYSEKYKTFLRILCIILSFLLVFTLSGCDNGNSENPTEESLPEAKTKTVFAFDTVISITYYYDENEQAVDNALSELSYYESIFSRTLENSELSQLNDAISRGEDFYASPELYSCIQDALKVSECSGGAFDITLGKITALWDFESESPEIPADSEIQKYLPYVGYQHLSLSIENVSETDSGSETDDADSGEILLRISSDEKNLAIDLGGTAKGFIATRIYLDLVDAGVVSAILDFGGNIMTIGTKPDNTEFQIGLQKPEKGSADYVASYPIKDLSMITSGNYERYFEKDNVRYHHILNPKTGYPVQNNLYSATVIGFDGGICDALSTAVYVLGSEAAMDLMDDYSEYHFVLMDKDLQLLEVNF